MAYRGEGKISCPRCKAELHGVDTFTCTCGVWVSRLAARVALHADEVAARPAISWWRVREPCPLCEEKMVLCGAEPGLFQGCDLHGFWVDADTIEHTGLARGIDHDAIGRLREDPSAVEAVELEAQRIAIERAERRFGGTQMARLAREQREQREANERELARVRRQREQLTAALDLAIGEQAARLLLERLDELDAANAQLANRVAELERRQP